MPRSESDRCPPRVLTLLCAYCQRPFESRRNDHRFCSAKCRSLGFPAEREQKRHQAHTERDAKVRLLLKEALTLLEPEKDPSL